MYTTYYCSCIILYTILVFMYNHIHQTTTYLNIQHTTSLHSPYYCIYAYRPYYCPCIIIYTILLSMYNHIHHTTAYLHFTAHYLFTLPYYCIYAYTPYYCSCIIIYITHTTCMTPKTERNLSLIYDIFLDTIFLLVYNSAPLH